MKTFEVKTHKPGSGYAKPHLFILSRGNNSGKPLREPCANCFVIFFIDQDAVDAHYGLAYSLWKAKFWHPHLVGSVISFLRVAEFRKEFASQCQALATEQEETKKNIEMLRLLEAKEAQFHKNLQLIADARHAILYRYIKR